MSIVFVVLGVIVLALIVFAVYVIVKIDQQLGAINDLAKRRKK